MTVQVFQNTYVTTNKKTSRGDKIRTYDPSHPIRVRYQTALHPDNVLTYVSYIMVYVKLKAKDLNGSEGEGA